jgi:putative glutamine amidotransferase
MRMPVIGVTASRDDRGTLSISREYLEAVLMAGGLPLIVPYLDDVEGIRQVVERIDGLLLTGGGDIDPTWFGEEPVPGLGWIDLERDQLEIALIRQMMDGNKPILAICRGCQILNVAAGGDMFQDLYQQREGLLQHMQNAPRSHLSHSVEVAEGSLLRRIAGNSTMKVNSFHHQAVRKVAPGFIACATAKDGVIEGVESVRHPFVLGVQWHPEHLVKSDAVSRRLFESFVQAASSARSRG